MKKLLIGCSIIFVAGVFFAAILGISFTDLWEGAGKWNQRNDHGGQVQAAEVTLKPQTVHLPEGQVFMYIDHSLPGDVRRYVTRDRLEGEKPRRIRVYEHIRSIEFLDVYLYIQEH